MFIMWVVTLMFLSHVAAQATSNETKMECHEFHDFPPVGNQTPSVLANLTMVQVTVEGDYMLNISWAINIDASIKYLTGTRIRISGESVYHCKYNPPLAETNLTGLKQIWFHYLVVNKSSYGCILAQASNLPLPIPGSGLSYKSVDIDIPLPKHTTVNPSTTSAVTGDLEDETVNHTSIVVAIFGGLAGLMILGSCYLIYKSCGANIVTSLGFKRLPMSPAVPVPVLIVYPAENSAFQQAVAALAEFLQWHGGCKVAVDMWQQGKIAELGPMRWLAEQVKAADRVLIVCTQHSSQPSHSPPNHISPEPSIPAAARDLYPLILNMVASHAKSASSLAKFWVVQLDKQQDKRDCNLAHELRACKTFCLMKDFNKLCRRLHTQKQGNKKISDMIFGPGIAHSEKSSVKLREAVEMLGRHQASIFRGVEPLKSVVINL
ncbi:uncharacterized protein LOC119905705 isoform X2 [Micropterus salmoides]|uniref:uncharacterized protein LOC119905705 isoform X2 n=1 Tax=Micropterus salmoides TaxID=27706 RepID=UPI0018EBC1DF|nr:uncharacterized protein LOC119905705 isoform X2 [Micropterus salmoides]